MVYSYLEDNGPSVGEETLKILSKEQPETSVGEIISEYATDYAGQMQEAVDKGVHEYGENFHVVVMHKKESWALNVLRNYFIPRKSCPDIQEMWGQYPNYGHTIYHFKHGNIEIVRSVPSWQEAHTVLKNWDLYHPDLVGWCRDAIKATCPVLIA